MIRSSNPALFEDSLNHMKPCLEGVGAVNFNRHIKHTSLSLLYCKIHTGFHDLGPLQSRAPRDTLLSILPPRHLPLDQPPGCSRGV